MVGYLFCTARRGGGREEQEEGVEEEWRLNSVSVGRDGRGGVGNWED